MVRLRRLGVISVANVSAAVTFVISLLFVVFIALVLLPARGTGLEEQLGFSLRGGVVVLLILPFIYAAVGWVMGAVGALVYNLVAGFTGGIQMDLDGLPAAPAATPVPPAYPPADVPPPQP